MPEIPFSFGMSGRNYPEQYIGARLSLWLIRKIAASQLFLFIRFDKFNVIGFYAAKPAILEFIRAVYRGIPRLGIKIVLQSVIIKGSSMTGIDFISGKPELRTGKMADI